MSITLIVVIVSQVCAYVQTHPIVCIKYIQVFVHQLYPIKLLLKRRTTVFQRIPSRKLTRKPTEWENILFKQYSLNLSLNLNFNSQ